MLQDNMTLTQLSLTFQHFYAILGLDKVSPHHNTEQIIIIIFGLISNLRRSHVGSANSTDSRLISQASAITKPSQNNPKIVRQNARFTPYHRSKVPLQLVEPSTPTRYVICDKLIT